MLALFGSNVWATEEVATVEELVERGFQISAQGELVEASHTTCLTLRVIGENRPPCGAGSTKYGLFRRLTKGDEAFVCVSFRNWTCFRSETAEPARAAEAPAP